MKCMSLKELFNTKFPKAKWVIKDLIPLNGITIISGAPGSYKTWIALEIARSIASKKSFLDIFSCKYKKNILLVDEENHPSYIQDRFQLLQVQPSLPINLLTQENLCITKESQRKQLLDICEERSIGLIVFDSLIRISDAEENDAKQMANVFRCIRDFTKKDITVIVIHHDRKENADYKSSAKSRLRGSSDILASIDSLLSLKEQNGKICIEHAKSRISAQINPFYVEVIESDEPNTSIRFEYIGSSKENYTQAGKASKHIIEALKMNEEAQRGEKGSTRKSVIQFVRKNSNIGEKSIIQAINDLIMAKKIREKRGIRNEKLLSLTKQE